MIVVVVVVVVVVVPVGCRACRLVGSSIVVLWLLLLLS